MTEEQIKPKRKYTKKAGSPTEAPTEVPLDKAGITVSLEEITGAEYLEKLRDRLWQESKEKNYIEEG